MESQGKYHDALNTYIESLALVPKHYYLRKAIGRMYRFSGDYDKSIDIFKQLLLLSPISGVLNFEIAKSYYAAKSRKEALEHIKITLDVWKDADDAYKPAIEANEKWEEWNPLN